MLSLTCHCKSSLGNSYCTTPFLQKTLKNKKKAELCIALELSFAVECWMHSTLPWCVSRAQGTQVPPCQVQKEPLAGAPHVFSLSSWSVCHWLAREARSG